MKIKLIKTVVDGRVNGNPGDELDLRDPRDIAYVLSNRIGEPMENEAEPLKKVKLRPVDESDDVWDDEPKGGGGGTNNPVPLVVVPSEPKSYASKPEWVKYAIARGADEDTANGMSKNDLVALYGSRAE
jgi:hypothetical protein